MRRRDFPKTIVAVAAGSAISIPRTASAQTCIAPCYPRTTAEITAGVTPTNYAHEPFDVRRYGAIGDGSTNDGTAIQAAINVASVHGGEVLLPEPSTSYNLVTTTLNVPSNVFLVGKANEKVKLTYTGTGYAIEFTGYSNGARNLQCTTSHLQSSGCRFSGPSQASGLQNVKFECTASPSVSRTGAGILFLANDSDNGFSGGFSGDQVYVVGFKYGHRYVGYDASSETWTCVTFNASMIVGTSTPIAGSKGIWFDSKTNGVGTIYNGGTCEGFDIGIQVEGGTNTRGLFFRGDLEANTNDWLVGNDFNGVIEAHNSGKYLTAGANGLANRWYKSMHRNGYTVEETYYGRKTMVYDHGGESARWELVRGPQAASIIDSGDLSSKGSTVVKFAVQMDDSTDQDGDTNWIEFCGHKMSWRSAAPGSGSWGKGDVVWNSNVSAGGIAGWVCTTAGSPGTWKAMATIAP